MKVSDVQIINTVAPKGDSDKYTVNFTAQSDDIGIGSGRVLFTKDEIMDLTENSKPQAVIDKIKKILSE